MVETTARQRLDNLRNDLQIKCGEVAGSLFEKIIPDALPCKYVSDPSKSKFVNDPIWKNITLSKEEVELLDTPLLQRLRRIRQLGLAHFVYPGANHTRLDHSLGALQAATRMFAQLADRCSLFGDERKSYERNVRYAALLHDCGHAAFSHVGERVLSRLFKDEFTTISEILVNAFPDPIENGDVVEIASPIIGEQGEIPVAETVSALVILSTNFEHNVSVLGITPQDILSIVGLILGRPVNLVSTDGSREYTFVKMLISGDLDADKVDYVARDAYFAGIPIAADVDRLISQLDAVSSMRDKDAGGKRNGRAERFHFGIRHAGVPALETFVLTRSYLVDRIYSHPKVRSAESFLERTLYKFVKKKYETRDWAAPDALGFLLGTAGDDAILWRLSSDDDLVDLHTRQNIIKILNRDLPVRSLALARRYMVGYDQESGQPLRSQQITWTNVDDKLAQYGDLFEKNIKQLLEMSELENVLLDWRQRNPIDEDPDILVSNPVTGAVHRVNRDFDAERFSNAYRDMKVIAWLFADRSQVSRVAAAASILLNAQFGMAPTPDACVRANVDPKDRAKEIDNIYERLLARDESELAYAASEVNRLFGETLRIPYQWVVCRTPVESWGRTEATNFGKRLADDIEALKVTRTYASQLDEVLPVLEMVLQHAIPYIAQNGRVCSKFDETGFRKNVLSFLLGSPQFLRDFIVDEEQTTPSGRSDIVVLSKKTSRKIAIELKSKSETFERLVRDWAGQPIQYSSDPNFSRVSILYCEYLNNDPIKDSDAIDIRRNENTPTLPLLAICVGVRRTTTTASGLGRKSKNILNIRDKPR